MTASSDKLSILINSAPCITSLMLGDCLDRMSEIPDNSIDMVLCDPPYTMTKRGKSCRPNWMPDSMGENVFAGSIPNVDDWMNQVYCKMNQTSQFYTFCNTNDLEKYLTSARKVGFKLHNIISMIKDTLMPNRWYLKQTELVLYFWKGKAIAINDKTSRDWCRVEMPTIRTGKVHITQKPLSFVELLVNNSSKLGDTVLDPFMGSGTTGVACVNVGRHFIGIERDPDYFEIAHRRIAETRTGVVDFGL